MAAHVHVTTTSSTEKNKAEINHMPCKIKKNGSANVSKYFQPNVKKNSDGVMTASFRGHPLLGKEIHLPKNYSGFVLQETQEKLSEDSDRNVYVIGSFDKLTYWNYDKVPSSADQICSVMDWIAISSAIFLRFGRSHEGLESFLPSQVLRDPEDNWITPSGNYNLINRVLQNNVISGSSSSLPKWRQDVGKNPFSIYNLGERGSGFRSRGQVQDFYELRDQCLQAETLFEDPEFPCENSSLFFSQRPPYGFEWKRPMEIVEDPQFFVEGVSRFDVEQGELGDCWLLAAIANLTLNSSLFYQIVPGDQDFEEDYCGIFHFRFWQYGRWVDVVIDDRLPTVRGELVFLRSSQRNEFWSALLEKAYAKLHGSYEALKGGSTCEAMEDFTAGVTEMYELNHEAPSNLFQMMIKAYERNSLMGCSLEPDPHVLEAKTPQGLVRGHAYSITRVTYVDIATPNMSGKIPLIRLRNPWGNDTEWNGAWSDQSAEWRFIPQHEKENIGLTFDNDGEFWMSYKDFMHYFDRLEICNLNPDSLTEEDEIAGKKKWEMSVFEGEWVRGVTAGGCRNHLQTFHHNPQYRITLTDVDDGDDENKCTVIIALMQKNRRSQRNMGVECLTIGFAIYHLDDPDRLPKPLNMEFFKYNSSCARSPSFINLREVSCRFRLSPGVYCIVPSTFDPNEEGEFLLRVFSEKKTHMEENDESVGMGKVDDRVIEPEPVDRDERKEKDDKVRQFFNKLAGEDLEVDWKELQEILDYAMREELPNRTSTTNGNLLSTLFTTFCGTICNDPSITQVFGETKREGFSKDVCRSMVAMLDVDRSGKLGFEEFKSLWTDIRNWKAVFKLYDKANSGQLSAFELRQALNSAGYRLNNHILNVLVHRYGTKEGSITFDDFMMCAVKLKSMIDIFKEKDPENTNQATFTLEEWVERTLYS